MTFKTSVWSAENMWILNVNECIFFISKSTLFWITATTDLCRAVIGTCIRQQNLFFSICLQYPLNPIQIRKKRCKWHHHHVYLHGDYFPLTSADCCVVLVYKSFSTSQHYIRGNWPIVPHLLFAPAFFLCTSISPLLILPLSLCPRPASLVCTRPLWTTTRWR